MGPLLIFIFLHTQVAVSSDVVKPVGSSVKLDIQKHVDKFDEILWKFNTSNTVIKYYNEFKKEKSYLPYKDRAEFNNATYSLTLKNLKKSDNGRYEAKTTGETEHTVANYTLSVLDPVETPVLTRVPDQQNNDTCNITLTCTGHDLSVSTNWFNENCEEKEMTSPEGITLLLSVRNSSSVICNISNPVSWNMSVMDMKDLNRICHSKDHQVGKSVSPISIIIIIIIAVIIIILVVVHWVTTSKKTESKEWKWRRCCGAGKKESTIVYDTVQSAWPSESEDASGTTPNNV